MRLSPVTSLPRRSVCLVLNREQCLAFRSLRVGATQRLPLRRPASLRAMTIRTAAFSDSRKRNVVPRFARLAVAAVLPAATAKRLFVTENALTTGAVVSVEPGGGPGDGRQFASSA